ncbi:MAG TPA: bifunctional 4-hydroxy-2-oxoglutarate aldolase/2-dehydro-3-deoxy-phosphogluconate aldolase [Thermoanaerobaculia bacterium]|nr:bifunctional 4-hydroxy-2-oxoglutarate aldolase/2-dehydro-3-deoxy-phosphogluconate aldolase [Thermoanaerobaculia bacterium]
MSRRDELYQHVVRNGIVGVVREDDSEVGWEIARAYAENGIRSIEITLTTPNPFELIARLMRRYGESGIVVAAGTVRGSNAAAEARRAGAQILVSPHTDLSVIDYSIEHDLLCVAGAATATEIIHAWEAGAGLIKVYPAGLLGGPAFFRTIRQPIRDVPLLAGGPVAIEEIEAYMEAGAVALNLAAALAPPDLVAAGAWDQVGRRVAMAVSTFQSRKSASESVVH